MIGAIGRRLANDCGALKRFKGQIARGNIRHLMQKMPKEIFKDDLYYDHEYQENFSNVVDAIHENPNREFNEKAVGYLLYNMAIVNKPDEIVFDLVERFVLRLRGQYNPRLAFGALSGGLRMNLKPAVLRVFQEDFMAHKEKYTWKELSDVYEGVSYNESLDTEDRQAFIREVIEPLMLNQWRKFRFQKAVIHKVFLAMTRMGVVGGDLYERIMLNYLHLKSMNVERHVEAYKALQGLSEKADVGAFGQEGLQAIKKSIEKMKDVRWTFNVDTLEPYTYEELYAMRDADRYPDQVINKHLSPQMRERWEEIKQEGLDVNKKRDSELSSAERMTSEQLMDYISEGKVVIDQADIDAIVSRYPEAPEEEDEKQPEPKNKGQKQAQSQSSGKEQSSNKEQPQTSNKNQHPNKVKGHQTHKEKMNHDSGQPDDKKKQ